ncbi:O-acetyl-ADP-ribose deacetylase [Candidatus Woesearchaeota archaeon]|nr:O-acetyl-ADP-ribose deacetylase [Candidatus Woesearchaeota archaeon]
MKVRIVKGDITEQPVDVIVNAANRTLLGGGGVDGAVHSKAGPKLLEECKNIRREKYPDGLPVGQVVITEGYNLAARHVIHTVGPVYYPAKDQSMLLAYCFKNSLDLAEKNKLRSIAFPAISTGAYKYPIEECAKISKRVFENYDFVNIKEVVMCLFTDSAYQIFKKVYGGEL